MACRTELKYHCQKPEPALRDFVHCFWSLKNEGKQECSVTVLPDGYFDILFTAVDGEPFKAMLIGLSTKPTDYTVLGHSRTFSISFKLTAAEYILKQSIAQVIDSLNNLPMESDWYRCLAIPELSAFAGTASLIIKDHLDGQIDKRKLQLFREIYSTDGAITVDRIAAAVRWNNRQINRYFRDYFGISLKKYCSILRFRASFEHLHKGQLFPEDHYYDQAHFIHEVNKFAHTTPRQLAKNFNDRFIQLATITAS